MYYSATNLCDVTFPPAGYITYISCPCLVGLLNLLLRQLIRNRNITVKFKMPEKIALSGYRLTEVDLE